MIFAININKQIHASLHQYSQENPKSGDTIPPVALSIAKQYDLIVFDEFQVSDIVDAVVLRRYYMNIHHYIYIYIPHSSICIYMYIHQIIHHFNVQWSRPCVHV
jgi:hypothetical protein